AASLIDLRFSGMLMGVLAQQKGRELLVHSIRRARHVNRIMVENGQRLRASGAEGARPCKSEHPLDVSEIVVAALRLVVSLDHPGDDIVGHAGGNGELGGRPGVLRAGGLGGQGHVGSRGWKERVQRNRGGTVLWSMLGRILCARTRGCPTRRGGPMCRSAGRRGRRRGRG